MTFQELIIIREKFTCGIRGKNLDQDIKYILLKDIEDDHLKNIIKHINENAIIYNADIRIIMETEHMFRLKQNRKNKLNEISIYYKSNN